VIVLFAAEPFFLGCCHDLTVNDKSGRRIVVKSGYA
jgi:hypothetical protein